MKWGHGYHCTTLKFTQLQPVKPPRPARLYQGFAINDFDFIAIRDLLNMAINRTFFHE